MSFHQYDISEIYSNADGTVQFIELVVGNFPGENLWAGHKITVSNGVDANHEFTFPANLPSSLTANTSVLIATQGFADLGLVTPDYIIPDGLVFTGGGTVNYASVDVVNYSALPGGTQSVNDNGVTGTNSPTNFGGSSASIPGNPIAGTAGADTLTGTAAKDYMVGIGGNDSLSGLGGADTLLGGIGNDTLNGGGGADSMVGGTGNDLYVVGAGDHFTELLGQGSDLVKSSVSQVLAANFEKLTLVGTGDINGTGNKFANTMSGNSGANVLASAGGNDRIVGQDGNDVLRGGAGNDTLTGGAGADKFDFNAVLNASTNVDTIEDYAAGTDLIRLDQTIFTQLASGQFLTAAALLRGSGATTAQAADDRIIYDSDTGDLYYDADGVGGVSSVVFATLTGAPVISPNDFFIIP